MMKDKILKSMNKQLNEELASSYEYLSMSAFFESINLTGFSHWFKMQSQEEYMHAMKIFDYINARDGKVNLLKIDSPKSEWNAPIEVFEESYKREQEISESINDIVDLAITEKDYATHTFLQWFLNEQVEEESTALKWLDRLKMIGDDKNGLFLIDRELIKRAE
jgi:ferritin